MAPQKEISVVVRAKNAVSQGLSAARSDIASWAGSVKGMLGGAFAILGAGTVGAFFGKAIEEVRGAERAITQLANTMGNFGLDLSRVRPEIDNAIQSLQKVANIDDDDAYLVLERLIGMTGNYAGSLKNLQLVADVAAKKNIDLSQAADIVGKTMAGQTKVLREFGISTTDAGEGVELLRARVAGAAATELTTLDGKVQALKLSFNDLAQEVGGVIVELPVLQDGTGKVGGVFDVATESIRANRVGITFWTTVVIDSVRAVVVTFWNMGQMITRAIKLMLLALAELSFEIEGRLIRLFNRIPRMLNAMIETANRLPGIDIAVRLPEFADAADARFAEARRLRGELEKTGAAIVGDLVDVGKAWLSVGDAAVAAADRSGDAARTMRKNPPPPPPPPPDDEKKKAKGGSKPAKDELQDAIAARAHRDREHFEDAAHRNDLFRDRSGEQVSGKLTAEGAKAYRDNAHKGWTVLAEGLTEKQVEEAAQRTARGITVDVPTRIDTFGTDGRGRATGILAGAADELMGADGAVRTLGDSIDALAKGPIMALDDAMAGAFEAMISGSGRASEAFKSAIGGAIKAVAQAEGRLYAGKALGALGEGLFTGKPNAFLAAAKYGSAATAFFALAGAGGAFGSGGGGGGGSAGSGGPTQEGGSLRGAVGAGKITVVLNGSRTVIDHRNNDDLDALREMLGTLAGNREIELVYGGR